MRTTSSLLPLNLPFFLLLTSLSQTSARPLTGAASLSASAARDASLESGSSQIYVSNLSLHTTDESLKSNFEQFGTVIGAEVISDTKTGKPQGYAYVTMASAKDAETAIKHADGEAFDGRTLKVSACTPKICSQGKEKGKGGKKEGEAEAGAEAAAPGSAPVAAPVAAPKAAPEAASVSAPISAPVSAPISAAKHAQADASSPISAPANAPASAAKHAQAGASPYGASAGASAAGLDEEED